MNVPYTRCTWQILAVVAVLVISPGSASAAVVEVSFSGTVSGVLGSDPASVAQVNVGDPVSGTALYDTVALDLDPNVDVGRYEYTSDPYGINLTIGDLQFANDNTVIPFTVLVRDNVVHDIFTPDDSDQIAWVGLGSASTFPSTLATAATMDIVLSIFDDTTNLIASDALFDDLDPAILDSAQIDGFVNAFGAFGVAWQFRFSVDEISFAQVPDAIAIDIKPRDPHNKIRFRSHRRKLRVAILTQDDFDALQVDPATVQFGPDSATAVNCKVKDVDHDGDPDFVLRFKLRETGIACGDTEATLSATTFDGEQIAGTDSIETKRCH